MRWNSFGGSLVFATAVALLLPAFWLGLAPVLGGRTAISIYLLGVAVVYVTGLGKQSPLRWWVAALVSCGAAALLALCASFAALATGAALLVSAGRALLFAVRPMRSLAIEALLTSVGLLAAASVAGAGAISIAFGLCAYLLVQSAFFLIGAGTKPRIAEPEDRFDQARDRLLGLLDEQA